MSNLLKTSLELFGEIPRNSVILVINENKLMIRKQNESRLNFDDIIDFVSLNKNSNINENLEKLGLEKVPITELVPKSKQIKSTDDIIGECCNICTVEYKTKEYKRELVCKHYFHKKCIDRWLKKNPNCPICRKDIF